MIRVLRTSLAFALVAAGSLPAQSDTAVLAGAIVRSLAPATDDPDAVAIDLLTQALAHRRSPVAWFLVQEAIYLVPQLQDPTRVEKALAEANGKAGERQHGRLAQKCTELQWWLDRAVDGPIRTGPLPQLGYCKHALVVGPLGDAGDRFAGVPLTPEFRFPALGAELPGRGTTAVVRRAATRRGSDYVELPEPGAGKPGCYFALHRFSVDAALDAFLEVEFEGDFQLFADGVEVLRVERWRATAPRRHYVPLHLPAGEHQVLLKTCSSDKDRYAMRWVDADAWPVPGVRQVETTDPAAALGEPATVAAAPFVTADDTLLRATEQDGADPAIGIAATWLFIREGHHDLALRTAEPLRAAPPADPTQALAFARALRSSPLPDQFEKAAARKIEEAAIAGLPADHHASRMASVQLLDEQDQREQALRLLAEHPSPGTATFQRRFGLLRTLKFAAEEMPLLDEWIAACPHDPRPWLYVAEIARAANDGARAHEARRRAAAAHRDLQNNLQTAIRGAAEVGDFDQATAWIEEIDPDPQGDPELRRVMAELDVAQARGDADAVRALLRRAAEHRDSNTATLLDLAGRLTHAGDRDATLACLRRVLAREADHATARRWLASLGELPAEDADFAAFRRDGDAARKAFVATEREQTASSTVLIDQRITEVRADGSWIAEIHELRRINDQAGVDAFRTAQGPSSADEVLFVRTIGGDGELWVPGRVENEYALQRLEPGVFVEWRYREHGAAPGADPVNVESFLFGSESEPLLLSEWVVILPASGRGQLRTRSLGEPAETRELSDGRKALVFRRENVPSLAREQFLPPVATLVPLGEVGEDSPPFGELRELRAQVGIRTRPTAPIRAQVQALTANLAGERPIVEAIWSWCQNEIESGPADSALDTLLHKKGSRFLLAMAMLRAADLQVVPLACAQVRDGLRPTGESLFAAGDEHDLPGALVTCANGERVHLFVDAPRHWPAGRVPASRAGTRAFALHDDEIEPIVLPGNGDAIQTLRVRGTGKVEGKEIRIEAVAELGDVQGYGLIERLRQLKDQQQKQAARQIAQQLFEGFRIRNAYLTDAPPGSPLRIEVTATRAGLQARGDDFVMALPLPPMKYVATFGDRAERTLPYWFPGDLIAEWDLELEAGDDHRFVACPAPVAIGYGALAYELQCTRAGDHLRVVRTTRLGPMTLPADRFVDWLRALADADRADQTTLDLAGKGRG